MIERLGEALGVGSGTAFNLIATVVTVTALLVARLVTVRAIMRWEDHDAAFRVRKLTTYTGAVLGVLVIGWIWADSVDNLVTYLGLVSAGVAIALSDLLKNIAGWMFILIRRPFRLGDRIEIDSIRGDVVDIRLFRFTVMEVGGDRVYGEQSTGRLIHIPNGRVFTSPIANYTEGFAYVWHEVPVLVTFESDWRKAREVVQRAMEPWGTDHLAMSQAALKRAARQYNIKVGALAPIVYMTVMDSGVQLTGRLLVDPRTRRAVDEAIWTVVLDEFAENDDLNLAYPTIRNVVDIASAPRES